MNAQAALTHQYPVRFDDLLLCFSTDYMSLSPLNVLDISLKNMQNGQVS